MSEYILREHSPRHAFPFNHLPSVRGSMYGGSVTVYSRESYGAILDSVYEMAGDVRDANGITAAAAVDQVCKDEGWRVMPRHKKLILAKLGADHGAR